MTPDEPVIKRESDPPPIQKIRTEEPQAPFGQDEPNPDVVSDATAEDKGLETADNPGAGDAGDPGVGGYGGRDPQDEMPRVPSVPETQEDPHTHGGAPNTEHEPPASTDRV
jgi:hypothetical protein